MELIGVGVLVVLSIAGVLYSLLSGRGDEQDVIKRRMAGHSAVDETEALRKEAHTSVAQKMMDRVAPMAMKPVMPKSDSEMTGLRIKLSTAGFRGERAPAMYLASKTILGGGLALIVLIASWAQGRGLQGTLAFTVFGAAIGFMGPNIWLWMAARKRAELIRNGLPDSLDLLVISVEAGLAMDGAIQRVGDEMRNVHPVLSEEFQIATVETQMGVPRHEALANMARRSGVQEVQSLVALVNQAEKFGTSIAATLRNQADALRTKRRQAAEERAQKTTVKLMAPLMLFIFPAVFVVLLGPAALSLYDNMINNPLMGGG
ncbi:MAG: type II secretion system F family protein [Planctomycetes bacterium]|nr:type II secretion system F family protein [Planctomycetota bacterium]